MKNIFYIVLLALTPLISFASVDNDNEPFEQLADQIAQAIKKSDATGVAKFFDSSVDIKILDKKDTHSKAQAEQLLKNFFTKNKVDKFDIIHNVDSRSGSSSSFVGKLTSGSNVYRVYVQMADSGSSKIIQEISIRQY